MGNGVGAQGRGELLDDSLDPTLPVEMSANASLLAAAFDCAEELGRFSGAAAVRCQLGRGHHRSGLRKAAQLVAGHGDRDSQEFRGAVRIVQLERQAAHQDVGHGCARGVGIPERDLEVFDGFLGVAEHGQRPPTVAVSRCQEHRVGKCLSLFDLLGHLGAGFARGAEGAKRHDHVSPGDDLGDRIFRREGLVTKFEDALGLVVPDVPMRKLDVGDSGSLGAADLQCLLRVGKEGV